MPNLTLTGQRTKAIPQVPLNVNLVSTQTYDDATDTGVEYISLENVAPVPATIAITTDVTTTLDNAIISGDFSSYNLREGDGVSGTGIAVGTKVASIINATTISLDQNATASGTVTDIVITPPTFNPNIFALVKKFSVSGSILTLNLQVTRADGTQNKDTTGDGLDNSLYSEYSLYVNETIQIDLDAFLTKLRVDRV